MIHCSTRSVIVVDKDDENGVKIIGKKLKDESEYIALLRKKTKGVVTNRWTTYSATSQYGLTSGDQPARRTPLSSQYAIDRIVQKFIYMANRRERELQRTVKFSKLLQVHELVGRSQMGLYATADVQIVVGRFQEPRKSTKVMNKRIDIVIPKENYVLLRASEEHNGPVIINFIVPAHGRAENLLRLLNNFIEVSNKHPRFTSLTVVSPAGESFGVLIHERLIYAKNAGVDIRVLKTRILFNRGKYRSIGADEFNSEDLLFFIDLDMIFDDDLLSKILLSTRRGSQVYFPIVYSQYDPATWSADLKRIKDPFYISEDIGYWRIYGFGMIGVFKSDLDAIGGWDVNIHGWGKEDVLIYEKFIAKNYTVLRSPEPSLVHVFHHKQCSSDLPPDQMVMCRGTQSLASKSEAKRVRNLGHLLRMQIKYNLSSHSARCGQ